LSETAYGGVTKEACAAWYGSLLTYKTMRLRARFYFDLTDPANAGVTTCATLGDWRSRHVYFLESM
jgi:hypothetical protein